MFSLFSFECAACAATATVFAWVRYSRDKRDYRAWWLRFLGPASALIFLLAAVGGMLHPQKPPAGFSPWWFLWVGLFAAFFAIAALVESNRPPVSRQRSRRSPRV